MALTDEAKALRKELSKVTDADLQKAIEKFSKVRASSEKEAQDVLRQILQETYGPFLDAYRVNVVKFKLNSTLIIVKSYEDQKKNDLYFKFAQSKVDRDAIKLEAAKNKDEEVKKAKTIVEKRNVLKQEESRLFDLKAKELLDSFVEEQKESILELEAKNIINKDVTKSNEWQDAISSVIGKLAPVYDAFFLSPSATGGKNVDYLSANGRNITIASVARDDVDLSKVFSVDVDWKKVFSSDNSFTLVQKRGSHEGAENKGTTFGGLSNEFKFGSNPSASIKAFVSFMEADSTIDLIKDLFITIAHSSEGELLQKVAYHISEEANDKIGSGVKTAWPGIEPYVDVVYKNQDKSVDDIKKLFYHDKFVDNLTKKGGELVLITNPMEVSRKNVMREGMEELSLSFDKKVLDLVVGEAKKQGVSPSSVAAKYICEIMVASSGGFGAVELAVGGEFARDPLFAYHASTGMSEIASGVVDGRTKYTTPECYAAIVRPENLNSVKGVMNELPNVNASSSNEELSGLEKLDLWEFMQFSGSVVDPENGGLTPFAGTEDKYLYSPLSDQTAGDKRFTYFHEAWVGYSIALSSILSMSFAAVLNSMEEDFSKAYSDQFDAFKVFVGECKVSGLKKAMAILSSKDSTKYAKVLSFVKSNQDAIVKKAKDVFEGNCKSFSKVLAEEYVSKGMVFDVENAANFIIWKTDKKLEEFSKVLIGNDSNLLGEDFARKLMSDVSATGREIYFGYSDAHKAQKDLVEAHEAATEVLEEQSKKDAYISTKRSEGDDSAIAAFISGSLLFPEEYTVTYNESGNLVLAGVSPSVSDDD